MATADNVITYTGIADALEDIPDSSAFTIEFIYPDSMRKVFPIYLISGKFWPVTEYSYRKHSVQYKDIKIPNIGVNIYYPLGDEISDTISMTFIEDHTRSIEAAVDTWIKHNMIHKATAIPYWNDTLSQTQSVSIRITTFDATRVNPVKKEEFELLPPKGDFTIQGSTRGTKGDVDYKLEFPIVRYYCEYQISPNGLKQIGG